MVLLLRVWQPKEHYVEADEDEGVVAASTRGSATRAMAAEGADQSGRRRRPVPSEGGSSGGTSDLDEMVRHDKEAHDTGADVFRAYAPSLITIIVFVLAQLPGIKDALDAPTKVFKWPGLDGLHSA